MRIHSTPRIEILQEDPLFIDITCEKTDELVGVEVQDRPHGKKILYVCVNGQTILRINRIPKIVVELNEVETGE